MPARASGRKSFAASFERSQRQGTTLEGITIIVPRYAYSGNIYHYAAAMSMVANVAANIRTILQHSTQTPVSLLDERPLNILFYAPVNLPWQASFERVMLQGRLRHVSPHGVRVRRLTQMDGRHVCVRHPVSLGQRGHVNAWPFANSSVVSLQGSTVPVDAVAMRADIYQALSISPPPSTSTTDNATTTTTTTRIVAPPLVLGYSRRAGRDSVVGNGVHAAGTVRRFSDADEAWFEAMLRNETQAAGIGLTTFVTTADESFDEQVRRMTGIGFLVGIHGANLANGLFMRPFAALLEILPADTVSLCYIGGSNSGLKYMAHSALVQASAEESGCAPDESRCQTLPRQRMVKIGTRQDRQDIVRHVRDGIDHIVRLNAKYGQSGVPVVHDVFDDVYRIKDDEEYNL